MRDEHIKLNHITGVRHTYVHLRVYFEKLVTRKQLMSFPAKRLKNMSSLRGSCRTFPIVSETWIETSFVEIGQNLIPITLHNIFGIFFRTVMVKRSITVHKYNCSLC